MVAMARTAVTARRQRNRSQAVRVVEQSHAEHQFSGVGCVLVAPTFDKTRVGAPVRAAEDAAIGVQRHLKQDHVDEQAGLPAHLHIPRKIIKIDQRQ